MEWLWFGLLPLGVISAVLLATYLNYRAERNAFIRSYMRANSIHPDYRIPSGYMLSGEVYVAILDATGWRMVKRETSKSEPSE